MTDIYDGPARIGADEVRVRLAGHVDPIDGRYHWRGMVFDWQPAADTRLGQTITVTVDGHTADAQLTEATPWGTYCIAGVGAPPYSGLSFVTAR